MAKKLNSVITFSSDFTQTVEDDHGQILQKSTGHMQFNRPLLFYWHTDSPHPQTLWYRKHELVIYDQRLQQATIKKVSTTIDPNLLPLMLLTGNPIQVLQHFTVTETNGDYTLKPTRDDSGLLIGVLLKMTPNSSIEKIEYQTNLGQKQSLILVTQMSTNR
ncbi:MAG: outer membrane lipoprotein chaperone LolA [Gammaproteobacteria bacterium]|nr:outer membrane lipoprotein chaperone LolA [Gammaproteobacteria bacterium]